MVWQAQITDLEGKFMWQMLGEFRKKNVKTHQTKKK